MNKKFIADSALLFVAFIWGATFVLVQQAISFLEPFTFNAIRFSIASLFILCWLILFNREQLKQIDKKFIVASFFIGVCLFLGYALQTFGLLLTTPSKAGFITGLSVVLVPLFAYFILKQKPRLVAIIGSLIAALGLFLLTVGDTISFNSGDLLVLCCAVFFAMHIIFVGKFTNAFPTLLLTLSQITVVAILSSFFSFFFEDWKQALNPETIFEQDVIIALFVTAFFATAFAFFAQTKLQQYTTPARVALLFATEPVFAAVTSYFWIDERLGMIPLVGCAFILCGMIFAEWPAKKKRNERKLNTAS